MRQKGTKRRGISVPTAVMMLTVSAGAAYWSLRAQFGSPVVVTELADQVIGDLEPDGAVDNGVAMGDTPGRDLLVEHGSFSPATPVRMAFATSYDSAGQAAPAGETGAAGARWVGADPPELQLGVVMIGENVRRAVLNGTVVGVGDRVAGAAVEAIERDLVRVTLGARRLTYDLEGSFPREFRSELLRRSAVSAEAPRAEARPPQENR